MFPIYKYIYILLLRKYWEIKKITSSMYLPSRLNNLYIYKKKYASNTLLESSAMHILHTRIFKLKINGTTYIIVYNNYVIFCAYD